MHTPKRESVDDRDHKTAETAETAVTGGAGTERTKLEILAEEIGPLLRWATTQVAKTST